MLQRLARHRFGAMLALAVIGSIGLPLSAQAFFCFSFSMGGGPRISFLSQNLTGPYYGPLVDYPSMGRMPGGWNWPGYGGNGFGPSPAWNRPWSSLPTAYGYSPYGNSPYGYSPYGYSGYGSPFSVIDPYGIGSYSRANGYPIGWGVPLGGLSGYRGLSPYGLGLPW